MNTKHWNWIQGLALAALLPLFAACSSEGDELLQGEEKQPVQVNITRATMNDGNDWSWQDNDQIKMSITPYGGTTTEYTLTYGSNTWNPSPEIGTITLPATAEAWWPSTASTSKFSFSHDNTDIDVYGNGTLWLDGTVDQSTLQNLANNDWMTSGQITVGSPSIDLTLQHRLAKVTVTITSSETINEVRFFSYTPNDNLYLGANNIAIKPFISNDTYTAIVSPYYYNTDVYIPFMWVTIGTTKKMVYLPNELGMETGRPGCLSPGMAYTFNLTVNSTNSIGTRSAGASECKLELVEVEDMNK